MWQFFLFRNEIPEGTSEEASMGVCSVSLGAAGVGSSTSCGAGLVSIDSATAWSIAWSTTGAEGVSTAWSTTGAEGVCSSGMGSTASVAVAVPSSDSLSRLSPRSVPVSGCNNKIWKYSAQFSFKQRFHFLRLSNAFSLLFSFCLFHTFSFYSFLIFFPFSFFSRSIQ